MSFITNLVRKIIYPDSYNGEVFIKSLRDKYHVDIGDNCKVWSPNQVYIDKTRPHMLHIGNLVKITRNVTILCHDYSRSVWCENSGGGIAMLVKPELHGLETMYL